MNRRYVTSSVVGILATGAMVGGPIAAASASNNGIVQDLVHAAPKLERAQAKIDKAERSLQLTGSFTPLIKAGRVEDKLYKGLIKEIKRTPASNATGARAKKDIVRGITDILDSNYNINTDLRHHHLTKSDLKRDQSRTKQGGALYKKGVKLLVHA